MRIFGSALHDAHLGIPVRLGRRWTLACQAWLLASACLHAQEFGPDAVGPGAGRKTKGHE